MVGPLDREAENSLAARLIHVYPQHDHVRTGNRVNRKRSLLSFFSHQFSPFAALLNANPKRRRRPGKSELCRRTQKWPTGVFAKTSRTAPNQTEPSRARPCACNS